LVGIVLGLATTFTIAIVALAQLVKGVGLASGAARTIAIVVLIAFGLLLLIPGLAAKTDHFLFGICTLVLLRDGRRNILFDAGAYRVRGALIIAGEHHDREPHLVQPCNRFAGCRAHWIGDREQSGERAVRCHVHDGLSLARERARPFFERFNAHRPLGKELGVSDCHHNVVHHRGR